MASTWSGAAMFPALLILLVCATSFVTGEIVEVSEREVTVMPGQNVSMLCRVGYPILYCRISIPGHSGSYTLHDESRSNGVEYFGSGLKNGECGATINRVEDVNNGLMECAVPPAPASGLLENKGVMNIIVARAPQNPRLDVRPAPAQGYGVNDLFETRCMVESGRPAAKISWSFGGVPLQEGLHQPVIMDVPGSADLKTSAQNLTMRLRADDNGRTLICIAEHVALPVGVKAQQQIEVKYEPQPRENPINIFGIKLGETALINVTLRSNPQPEITWQVNGHSIQAGSADPSGRMEASSPLSLGQDYYNATLRIAGITRDDTEKTYQLIARNERGVQEYRIRISTLDEPQGVELDTGSIVGIVVAVLIILIAVFLIVFAKATNRWCFGGEQRSADARAKSSGESSDTESAVAGPKSSKRRLPMLSALRKALPGRNKEKTPSETATQQTTGDEDEPKDLPEAEQKKSLVYAELQLNPQMETPARPPPDSTEYAEIVYKDESKEPPKE